MTTRYITNSEIQAFKDCRRKWWLGHVRKLRPLTPKPSVATMGTMVHQCLEALYTGRSRTAVTALDAVHVEMLRKYPEDGPEISKQADMAHAMLEGFDEWQAEEGLDCDVTLLATETRIEVPFNDRVTLLGKLDVLVRRDYDGQVFLRDWKTVQTLNVGALGQNDQFRMYALILSELPELGFLEDRPWVGAQRVQLRRCKRTVRSKPPFFALDQVFYTGPIIEAFRAQLAEVVQDICALEDSLDTAWAPHTVAYPRVSSECSWKCEYAGVCPMFDDGSSDAEGFLRNYFVAADPLERYTVRPETTEDTYEG